MAAVEPAGTFAVRAEIVYCVDDPLITTNAVRHYEDGLLVVESGHIAAIGDALPLLATRAADLPVADHRGKLLLPGFIDCHVHYPQTDMIASQAEDLLDWLRRYAFLTERRFEDPDYAADVAEFFLDELLRNGTTTALVLGTVHAASADALFEAAQQRAMRIIVGKVLMDRNCPPFLRDTAQSGYDQSRALIERWHGRDRLLYAITPRFAPTSTAEQLALAGVLAAEFPDVFIQSHLAETKDEVAWVRRLFPHARSYLDVYDHYGLLRQRAIYAHCIYLETGDHERLAATDTAVAFCPTANLFLGSGMFDYQRVRRAGITVGLGTDVGGGTSFSLLSTLMAACNVSRSHGYCLDPVDGLYMVTLGGARALGLDHVVGHLQPGAEADFTLWDWQATPLLARRSRAAASLTERLFALIVLGDDRHLHTVWINGRPIVSCHH